VPRIISGRFRGLKLVSPAGRATRPTADQVKEAIFSMLTSLSFDFDGARGLDFFAGSGSLGLEALSRGAASMVLADCDRAALTAISRNVAAAGPGPEVTVLKARWPQSLKSLPPDRPFDLFLLDPPYEERALPLKLLRLAAEAGLARPGAMAVWEQSAETLAEWSETQAWPWRLLKTRAWGGRAAAFLEYPDDLEENSHD